MKTLLLSLFSLLIGTLAYAQTVVDESASDPTCPQTGKVEKMIEDVSKATLTMAIQDGCVGVDRDYIKKIFNTSTAHQAMMNFLEQSFCFRKKDGSIGGCYIDKPRRLASVTKVFSMGYLYKQYGETDLSISATLSEQGSLCLNNGGISNITSSELEELMAQLTSDGSVKTSIKSVCLSEQWAYEAQTNCMGAYTDLMHNQTSDYFSAVKSCARTTLSRKLSTMGYKNLKITQGKCQCSGTTVSVTSKLKDRVQHILALSDSWQIQMLYDKLGKEAKDGLQDYVRTLYPDKALATIDDQVGNSPLDKATCESVLNYPTIKDCESPPLACGDTPGATFGSLTRYAYGFTPKKPNHEEYYEKLDDHFCGKTGSVAGQGVRNLVGCFNDKATTDRPIEAFAILLDGKGVARLNDMVPHTQVLEDFYQQLLDPETQLKLLGMRPPENADLTSTK